MYPAKVLIELPGENESYLVMAESTPLPLDAKSRLNEIKRLLELSIRSVEYHQKLLEENKVTR